MSPSCSALQFGRLLWRIKFCQDSVWSETPKKIVEIDDTLGEVDVTLPCLADKISRTFEQRLERVVTRIEKRHRFVADQNVSHFLSLLDRGMNVKDRNAAYHDFLVNEANVRFREWQKEDRRVLVELLETVFTGDKRLQGYFQIGYRLGDVVDRSAGTCGLLSKRERDYILAGLKKMPVREQREIEPFFLPAATDLVLFVKRIEKLERFLRTHEDHLIARPKWDGKTIAYRGQAEDLRIQSNSVMTAILDEAEDQGWPESIRLSAKQMGNKRSVCNAIYNFQSEHLEFAINGDRIMWGPPCTVKRSMKRRTGSV
jgi:hypothetical protein